MKYIYVLVNLGRSSKKNSYTHVCTAGQFLAKGEDLVSEATVKIRKEIDKMLND